MNKKNITNNLILIIIIVLVGVGVFFVVNKKSPIVVPITDQNQITKFETSILYSNTKYGFDFTLPITWKGYSILEEKWNGQTIDTQNSVALEGPKILIRNSLWTKDVPRQDIPIMIFTLAQWSLIQQEKLSVGAAPIPPSELGRNKNYVFALPARYNFAYLVGFEEVQKIIESKALHAF